MSRLPIPDTDLRLIPQNAPFPHNVTVIGLLDAIETTNDYTLALVILQAIQLAVSIIIGATLVYIAKKITK
uniref:Uncharacterized protein n=1 Tax=Ditylenchus dipsaci TaxID=166011 RepID=A0A915EBC1_9BILA